MKCLLLLAVSLLSALAGYSQLESLKGNVRSVREKLIFLDEKKQNLKLFSSEGDYGHYGFASSSFTFARFNDWWFNTPWVHYLNYFQEYDTSGKVRSQTWYKKTDKAFTKFLYTYDTVGNLIQVKELDSDSSYSIDVYSYNYQNRLRTTLTYYSDDVTRYHYSLYLYDEDGHLIESTLR